MTQLVYANSYDHVIRVNRTPKDHLSTYTTMNNFYVFKNSNRVLDLDIALAVETLAEEKHIRFQVPTSDKKYLTKIGEELAARTRGACDIPFALDIDPGNNEIALMRMYH